MAEYIFDRLLDLQIDYFERHPVGAIAHDVREADKIRRLGADSVNPKKVTYKPLTR